MTWCACLRCGEQKGEGSFGQVALDSVNMTFILIVVSSNTAQDIRKFELIETLDANVYYLLVQNQK